MPRFSRRSRSQLQTCDPRLRSLFEEAVRHFDCSILKGHRGEEAQNAAFDRGDSQLRWPDGNHNSYPSLAVDVAPYPINWEDRERFTLFAGFVLGLAAARGIPLRWGGDWDSDWQVRDNNFDDLVHFEIHE